MRAGPNDDNIIISSSTPGTLELGKNKWKLWIKNKSMSVNWLFCEERIQYYIK